MHLESVFHRKFVFNSYKPLKHKVVRVSAKHLFLAKQVFALLCVEAETIKEVKIFQ